MFNPTRFIKVYFIFSALMLVFAIRIYILASKNERPAYLCHIISHLGKRMMITLVDQRRVGKRYMLVNRGVNCTRATITF